MKQIYYRREPDESIFFFSFFLLFLFSLSLSLSLFVNSSLSLFFFFSHFFLLVQHFLPTGWNVRYDFNDSDIEISQQLLRLYLNSSYEWSDGDARVVPWGAIKYLIGDAMYGGRVTDDFDRRVLRTYLNEYMGDFIFDTFQTFYFSQVGFDYTLPANGVPSNVETYNNMVETLPLINPPGIFGLHANAEISYLNIAADNMWLCLIDLQPRLVAGGGGMSREEHIAATASDIQAKVPKEYDLMLIAKQIGVDRTPAQIVLLQELERFNTLVVTMSRSLSDLQKALVGEIGMSDSLDELGVEVFNGFLPSMFRRLAPNTQMKLGPWIGHFTRRMDQYTDWIENGEPAVMWLSGLGSPQSYLTSLIQSACRRLNWSLDRSTMFTKVTNIVDAYNEITEKPTDGCYVTGLWLEGGAWDLNTGLLRYQDPKVLVTELPVLQVIPVEANRLKLHGIFLTPVYVTQDRRNAMGVGWVFDAHLASDLHESVWSLQGVVSFFFLFFFVLVTFVLVTFLLLSFLRLTFAVLCLFSIATLILFQALMLNTTSS